MSAFEQKIIDLINTQREDDYWDFKEQWHENNAELLHDIISLSNNRTNEDGLLIFGVRDKTFEIIGVEKDPNRKNQQNIVDFLHNIKFSSGIRPSIEIKSMEYKEHELDILIIKNTFDTPYFITEDYRDKGKIVNKNSIYTRVKDNNTPINESADINHIEYLWKKRFGLTKSPINRMFDELKIKENWKDKYNSKLNATVYYNIYNPEYTIEIIEDEEDIRNEFYCYAQVNESTGTGTIIFKYFNTEVYSVPYVYLDGCRYITPTPTWGFIDLNNNISPYAYKYFTYDSYDYLIQQFLLNNSDTNEYSKSNFDKVILYFNDNDERKCFEQKILNNKENILNQIEAKKKEFKSQYDANLNEDNYIKQHLAIAYVFKKFQKEEFYVEN